MRIKPLSEFKDDAAIKVVAELLEPICNIVKNPQNAAARANGVLGFACQMLQNNSEDVRKMLAILSETPFEEYHCNGITVFQDALTMLGDPELMQLFGLQSQTMTSAGSASENIEVTGL